MHRELAADDVEDDFLLDSLKLVVSAQDPVDPVFSIACISCNQHRRKVHLLVICQPLSCILIRCFRILESHVVRNFEDGPFDLVATFSRANVEDTKAFA